MSDRIIKTGLSKKYKDMLDSVLGQMSDGYWENTPRMEGYWKFCDIGTAGGEITIEVDTTSGEREGVRFIENRFYRMSDDAIKKFFADKIKFLIKEEGLGKWDRGNERETDFLSYGEPRYRVKDCYYAYEILKGRNARKHPEYCDVVEANMKTKESVGDLDRAQVYDKLLDNELFTPEELDLVTNGWGLSMNTLNTVCQARYGMDADELLDETE